MRRLTHERGSVLVLVAAAIFPLMILLGFATDVPHWFDYSRNLQNRADAAALAAGDQFGNICAGSPTAAQLASIGQMAQLFSGPTGSASDLPYPYSGAGSPPSAFPQFGGYQNVPNLLAGNDTTGSHYHVRLNANNYATSNGTNWAMDPTFLGDFCHGDPTLDETDKECFGAKKPLQGQLANDCAVGAMVDVKVTQDSVPLFFPFVSRPNISAHARVTIQGIGSSTNLKPLGVRDPGAIPCMKVNFIPTGGTGTPPATQTITLLLNKAATANPLNVNKWDIWDNSTDSGGGDQITVPNGWNLYMQTIMYAQGASGTCSTMKNPLTYEQSSGILYLNSYPQTSLGTLPNNAVPKIDTGGVTLGGGCTPDMYFSSSGNCALSVTANVAFPGNAGTTTVKAVDTVTGNSIDLNHQPGTNTWTGSGLVVNAFSGQHPICIQVSETAGGASGKNPCPNGPKTGSAAIISLGVQQQAFAACNENFNAACGADPNISGPIVLAEIGSAVNATNGALPVGPSPTLTITVGVQGLQDSPRTDRCSAGPTQCTLLRVDQGNADGMVDCGEGNSANAGRAAVLYGCPLYGQTATAANPSSCSDTPYCGGWIVTPDGSCNNGTRTATSFVDCVNTNNQGATMPECIQALVVAGGSGPNPGTIDYSLINSNNCHVNGNTCSEDKWLDGAPIFDGNGNVIEDPRIISTFIVYQGDIQGATGNHDLPIRTFASFYVTGWQIHGGGQIDCGNGIGANEPAPSNLPPNADAIWGHWITYTEPGGGGNGTPCNFNAFGDCAAVLTR
jgi:hypothetical protein